MVSLDALRGFDMFWIVGAESLFHGLNELSGSRVCSAAAVQLEHSGWAGFTFYDLVFPLFIFIAGAAMTFSLDHAVERGGRAEAVRRLFHRMLWLWGLGILYYGGIAGAWGGIRVLGVLQRIGIACFIAGMLSLWLPPRRLAAACAAILLGYWALLALVPVPGIGAGDFAEGRNLADWFDARFLPGRKWSGDHDPEGILSTIPAAATCIMGMLAARWLRYRRPPRRWIPASAGARALALAAAGFAAIVLGWLWHPAFPVIKKIWSSSYVLVSGGWSAVLLAGFYYAIDGRGREEHRLVAPFVWLGANSIVVYFLHNIVDMSGLSARFVGGRLGSLIVPWDGVAISIVALAITVLAARFLYVRKILIRI